MTIHLPLHKQFHPEAAESEQAGGVGEAAAAPGGEKAPAPLARNLRVGDLAKRTGKTVRALHLYEELGLLQPATRSNGGYRLYNGESELRVRWIDKLQTMGFSLSDIKQIVQDVDKSASAPDAMTRVKGLFREKLEETRDQIRKLRAPEHALHASLTYPATCDSCATAELPSACTVCARHDCDHKTPDLVAGFRVH